MNINTIQLPVLEVSKDDFLLVWIFSIVRSIALFPIVPLSEITNGIDIVFFFVQNKMVHLNVNRKSESLSLQHGHACIFHKMLKRKVCT